MTEAEQSMLLSLQGAFFISPFEVVVNCNHNITTRQHLNRAKLAARALLIYASRWRVPMRASTTLMT